MELGSYSAMVTGETLRDKMTALKALGYDFIELRLDKADVARLGPEFTASIQADVEAIGLPVRSGTLGTFSSFLERCQDAAGREAALAEITAACELLSALGADVLLLPAWDGVSPDDGYQTYGTNLGRAAGRAQELGVKLAVEHIPSSKFTGTLEGVCRIADAAGHPHVGVYADIGNAMHSGEDPVQAIKAAGARVFAVHFKGYRDERPLEKMPLDEVRVALEQLDFQGRGAVEMKGGDDNAVLKTAIATLREHGF